ncbi:hypothetical protein KY326_02135 [Candidatus Woesearchaeota archaeon]|nr:hypothetical protein [Candidatus Woesearchaeota archaeon]
MNLTIYPTCYRYPNIFRCEYGEECEVIGKPGPCTADYMDTMDPDKIEILELDCKQEGYTCVRIEGELLFLNSGYDTDIDGFGKDKGSFLHQMRGDILIPFPGKMPIGEFFHIRASEFGGRCGLAKLISKFRPEFMEQFSDSELSIAGTIRHEICNTQPEGDFIHNRTLGLYGSPVFRSEDYCEQVMEYVMTVDGRQRVLRGHSDGVLRKSESIGILDFKRILKGGYEKPSIRIQLLIYALAKEQHENRLRLRIGEDVVRYDPFYLISVKRPFPPAKSGTQRKPMYHITKIDRDASGAAMFFAQFRNVVAESFQEQLELIEDPEAVLKEIAENRAKDICTMKGQLCFNYEVCNMLREMVPCGTDLSDLLDPAVRFDLAADDPEALEIEQRLQRKV